ncbi:hydrolase, HAD subfamily IIIA [Lachnospiraceae bacterium KM106-2]|nr:hydrolase, HAD subfamily IIIA [Lachnospiraceae bacterium KM106-2]
MFQRFYPDEIKKSAYEIDYERLYQEGYRGLLFDIDNTLVEHGKDATEESIELFKRLKKIGFEVCLISNNKVERVERFNKQIQVKYIFDAHKPRRKNYLKAVELMGTNLKNTIFVGDQLFTDVYGAKRTGLRNILVEPIDPKEEIQIVLKRYLEKIVLHFYRKSKA